MTQYLLDTSVIISYLRGRKPQVDVVDSLDGELTTSFVCLSELYEGIARVKDSKSAEKTVLEFFEGMDEVYGVDENVAKQFGFLRSQLKKSGEILEDLDILIAATCIAYGATLVTENVKHFSRVSGLEIVPTN